MMNSNQFMFLLDQLSKTKKTKEKIDILKQNKEDAFVHRAMVLTLDPFITFGIDAEIKVASNGKQVFTQDTFYLLENLVARNLTGNAAKKAIEEHLETLCFLSRELFWRIVKKDLRCGVGIALAERALDLKIKTYSPMLAEPLAKALRHLKFPLVIEPKLNGMRLQAIVDYDTGVVEFKTRTGRDVTSQVALKAYLLNDFVKKEKKVKGKFVFDGEATDTSNSFNTAISKLRKKEAQADTSVFNIFDGLPYDEFLQGQSKRTLLERRTRLYAHYRFDHDLIIKLVPQFLVFNMQEAEQKYQEFLEQGYEGAMLKKLDSYYHTKRCFDWVKMKPTKTEEAEIVDAYEGEGQFVGRLGGFIVKMANGEHTKIGGGFSSVEDISKNKIDERTLFWQQFLDGELAGRIIEIEFQEHTEAGKARHANFIRFRDIDGDIV